jgi:hypothetical protein
MPQKNVRDQVLRAYTLHLAMRDTLIPLDDLDTFEMITRLQADIEMFQKLRNTRYFNPRTKIPKSGSLHLAGEYAKNPAHHELFTQMLCVSPGVFSWTTRQKLTLELDILRSIIGRRHVQRRSW